ncbi:MAG: hypothetical protein IT289_09645 [Oligoflexia bacterium]|nr:hypothetical protein [Oligoflexia bacterium]
MRILIFIPALILTLAFQAQARKIAVDEMEELKAPRPRKEAETGSELRKIRRVGVGAQAAGALGMGGLMLELNISPKWSFDVGFGGGSGYQAVSFSSKYVLAGDYFMPYVGLGYSHWRTTRNLGKIEKTTPSIIGEKLLSQGERDGGEFQKHILSPGIGLQFLQLKGEWAGSSLYAEITVLLEASLFVAAPTGAIGFLYYF